VSSVVPDCVFTLPSRAVTVKVTDAPLTAFRPSVTSTVILAKDFGVWVGGLVSESVVTVTERSVSAVVSTTSTTLITVVAAFVPSVES